MAMYRNNICFVFIEEGFNECRDLDESRIHLESKIPEQKCVNG